MSNAPKNYTDDELAGMSQEELTKLGLDLDRVDVVYRPDRWPVEGTKAEKRAQRFVAFWFILAGVAAIGFIAVYLFWPHAYAEGRGAPQIMYNLWTPLIGVTMGLSILSLGIGAVAFAKRFIPYEVSIQDRHDGNGTGSPAVDRATTAAVLGDAYKSSTIGRRPLIRNTLIGAGVFAGIMAILPLGGLVKNPWAKGKNSDLWVSGWTPRTPGETIYLRRDTGRPGDVVLVRPEDLDAGGMETVFPFRASDRGNEEALLESLRGIRNAVMLIRLRPEDTARVTKRQGQESFNYGDYFAYSKICTHLGCPTSLYESQTNRILCPCHQSQFDALQYGKPIFGPAARALPQLPITVNKEGYLVANGDFIEALGPAFWERPGYEKERQS